MGGGVFSGAPLWLLLGIVFVFVLFKGFFFWMYLLLSLLSLGISYYLCYLHPEWVFALQVDNSIHLDSFIALICVSLLCGLLIKFQSLLLSREVQQAEKQAEDIEKMNKAQTYFFSSVSHEIRTPISSILGLNELILREKQISPEVRENAQNIREASETLLSLVNDLLDMSRLQAGRIEIMPERYDTNQILDEINSLHRIQAEEKKLSFEIQKGEHVPQVLSGDKKRVKQVMTNLLSNAVKYTNAGAVTLRFGGEPIDADTFRLRIEVEDTGIGVRKENLPYIFDTFRRVDERTNRNIAGTGLGLSITKELVEKMGGTIYVNSIYTRGSTFRVEIPQKIVHDKAPAFGKADLLLRRKQDYQQSFEAPRAAVLVVDDNKINRMVCQKLLAATKVQVDLADSGRECLSMTRQKHYHAIFMDHEMPQMDGIATLNQIKTQSGGLCRETPVVALTANAGEGWEEFYLKQGFNTYLSKPIESDRLEAVLLACLPEEVIEHRYVKKNEATRIFYEAINKRPYVITTESIADMGEKLQKEYDIRIMPYYIETKEGRFRDLEEIDSYNLQQYLSESGDNSARSQPASVEEYEDFFGESLKRFKNVLHITSSRTISGAYYNAIEAAKSFDNVYVFDSATTSAALSMVIFRASELLQGGADMKQVISELEQYVKKTRLYFLLPSLPNAVNRQNVPFLLRVLKNLFVLEPVFTVRRGKLRVWGFIGGYLRNNTEAFIRSVLRKVNKSDLKRLYVVFSGVSQRESAQVLEFIKNENGNYELISNHSSSATLVNCGPDGIGLIYEE
ncbi:MAG: DegV family EDD domain-containing protein [Lachnospiraceae bacterium]|nr:DegV family EDD domain-containing protein [Lachnospiraceae bacterium]